MPWCHHGSCHTQSTDSYKSKGDGLAFVAFEMPNLGWPKKKKKKEEKKRKKKKKASQMHENDQATIKTRYCGHLYSPPLRKRTC
jgi:hypothetical protein